MKEYIYITLKQLVASYMDKYRVCNISFTELKRWSNYIKKYFKDVNLEVISLLTKESILKFEKDDLFYIKDKAFCLKDDKTLDDVYKFCSHMSKVLILKFVFGTDNFVPKFEDEKRL